MGCGVGRPGAHCNPRRPGGSGVARPEGFLHPLLLLRRFKNVHADDQALLEPIAVENPRIGDELARVRVVDPLVDIDRDGPVRLLGEALGLDLARDGGELSVPVVADGRAADHPTALPGVGPIDLGIHQLDRDIEVIREAFGRWNERDIEYWIRHAQPDVEIWSKYASPDEGGDPYRGHAGMREWRAEIDRNFELHEVFADEVREVGGKVLVLGRVHFRGEASGIEMRHPFAWVCEMRDGAPARMLFYSSHADALGALGLAE
jgi:ketosteroid isomerase-like protein